MHELNKETICHIEKIFGFTLHEWQISYLLDDVEIPIEVIRERRNGKTFINILKLLFKTPDPLDISTFDKLRSLTFGDVSYTLWFRVFLMDIYYRLNEAGIITRNIITARGELKNGR